MLRAVMEYVRVDSVPTFGTLATFYLSWAGAEGLNTCTAVDR